MHKILIISYHFPPNSGVGTFRIAKIVKYLSQIGYEIHAITGKQRGQKDLTFLNDVESCKVHPIGDSGFKIIRLFQFYYEIKRVIREFKPSLLYFNGDPFYYFILGPVFKNKFNIPYVLDFRDPWYLSLECKSIKKIYVRLLEKFAVSNTDYIINVTHIGTEQYQSYYSKISLERFVTIENGYDTDDFNDLLKQKDESFKTIIFTGKTYINCSCFFESLSKIVKNKLKLPTRFIYIGHEFKEINLLAKRYGISDIVYCPGVLSYRDTLSYIALADIGIATTSQDSRPPTKLFDYHALKVRILGITNNTSYISYFINDTHSGICVPNTADAITDGLLKLLDSMNEFSFINSEKYTREYQVNLLNRHVIEPLIIGQPK